MGRAKHVGDGNTKFATTEIGNRASIDGSTRIVDRVDVTGGSREDGASGAVCSSGGHIATQGTDVFGKVGVTRGIDVLAERLGRIPFAPMAVIALGFAREAVAHDLDGFGMLVPGQEQRDLLGER